MVVSSSTEFDNITGPSDTMIHLLTRLAANFTVQAANADLSRAPGAIESSVKPTVGTTHGTAEDDLILVNGVVSAAHGFKSW